MELWGIKFVEVKHQWMPDWCYVDGEVDEVKARAIKYGPLGYTVIEEVMVLKPSVVRSVKYVG